MGMPTIRTGASQGRSVNDNMLRADRYRSLVAHSAAAEVPQDPHQCLDSHCSGLRAQLTWPHRRGQVSCACCSQGSARRLIQSSKVPGHWACQAYPYSTMNS